MDSSSGAAAPMAGGRGCQEQEKQLDGTKGAWHGAAANSIGGGIYLNTYAAMQPYIKNGSFLNSILQNGKASAMPKNGAKMDNCSILKIQSWINKGAINN